MRISNEGYHTIKINTIVFAIITAVVTAVAVMYSWPWWIWVPVEIFLLWRILFVLRFFRDPVRPLRTDDELVYAPADGRIVVIEEVEEKEFLHRKCIQISVYMTFYNVHVNWFPVSGRVIYKNHFEGTFLLAWRPKSSEQNEHTSLAVQTESGAAVMFRQIAGWVARRVVTYSEEGDTVQQNSKCGFIKFGSRVDVFVPVGSEILVGIDQRVVGSQTPLARLPKTN